jgi:hypothetical protein
MKHFQRFELLACLLGLLSGLASHATAAEPPTVAVLDFIGTNGPVDSALLGAADLLESELSRYEVRVISRRELNLLRGERGLARSGFARIEDFQGGALPWADFLLRGEYQYGSGNTGLRVRLVDAATGTECGSWQLLVERPADLVRNLDPILPKIATAVCGERMAPPRPRNQPGFTAIPEAASTFYHGLDHLVAGRPEYAAEYFRIAAADDPGFSLAVLAQAKAYELLGFPGVANAVRGTIPADQLPQVKAASTSAVLTVRFVDRSDAFTPGQMQRIRAALQETHGFALFEPDWIPALTRETDLKLSEDFPLVHGLDHRLWLRADHFIVFSAEKKGLSASVIDLLHGQLLGTVTGGATDLDGLCAQAVAVIRQPGAASPAPLSRVGTTNGPTVRLTGGFSVDEVAYALRSVADHPREMACWSHLLVLIQYHPAYQTAFRAFVPYFEAAIPRDTPDTPVWLAVAGWMRYIYDAEKVAKPLPMEGYFTELLERFPDHLQALMVRYNAALVPGYRGDLELSLPVVLEVEAKVAAQVAAMDDFIPIRGCHIDAITQLNYEDFPVTLPPHGPRMNMLVRGIYTAAAYMLKETGKPAEAEPYIEKHQKQVGHILYGDEPRHHLKGPMSIHPTVLGLWQTGHIGYEWQPSDPADAGRVLVGWTFMPYTLPGWQIVQAEFLKKTAAVKAIGASKPPVPAGDKPQNPGLPVQRPASSQGSPTGEVLPNVPKTAQRGAAALAETSVTWPYIKFDGFMKLGARGSVPVMNGEKVVVRQSICGAEVVAIDDQTVKLRYKGQTITLQPGQATGKPRDLEAEAVAEYLRQNPDLPERLRAQRQQSVAAANALRNDPTTGPIARIFLPPRAAAPSSLEVWPDTVDAHLGYLTHIESQAGRALTLADVSHNDPEGFLLMPGIFIRGTLWALQREGRQGALRFARDFIDSYRARRTEFAAPWGGATYWEALVNMCWMAAGAQETVGDVAGARAILQKAMAEKLDAPLVLSVRYMAARAAHRAGEDFEASEILRALVENPKSKDAPLRLPEEARQLGTVYAESVALLETLRHDTGKSAATRPE